MNTDILNFIYNLKREGIKYDLNVMKDFDQFFGFPHRDFKSVHITGSNGKGSVANMIFNVLRKTSSCGLYTSPHLVRFNERIFAQDREISDSEIEQYLEIYKKFITGNMKLNRNPTFFEVTTEMAFQYFKDRKMDWASIEVGLGGRLDATNIITPKVSVITRISYEHTDKLGTTLMEIAREKGGIIKENVPIITGETKEEPLREMKKIAKLKNAKFVEASKYASIISFHPTEMGSEIEIKTEKDLYHINLRLAGSFQAENVRTAISAIENLPDPPDRSTIEKGLENARWPGRMEIIGESPKVMIDSSHNPSAALTLANSINEIYKKKPLLVVGMLSDKDHYSYLHNISKCADSIVLTTPVEPKRSVNPYDLKPIADDIFKEVKVIPDPMEAYEYAIQKNDFILITGSMYLIGEISSRLGIGMKPFWD
ncbi:bifunctional folylpolyglutamate synthase/dihydrofolate synthase [Cuniculiplasma sp. SKW4]|uniref:bifunctional folylpolyglutamate synthase/dihydrofolate synthase n=1 Tax=Cuniculiplasma sp. SKW4 TaxID=3400171 RepID=UPI003FD66313